MDGVGQTKISKTLADAIENRRREVGLDSITTFAAAAGVTTEGLRPLRRGEVRQYQERLTGPVCRVLGWTPDSIHRLMRGEPPILLMSQDSLNDAMQAGRHLVEALGYDSQPMMSITQPDDDRFERLERSVEQLQTGLKQALRRLGALERREGQRGAQ